MSEDKRKIAAQLITRRPNRLQEQWKRGDSGESTFNPLNKSSQFTFPREVVLRLIDWIKQI